MTCPPRVAYWSHFTCVFPNAASHVNNGSGVTGGGLVVVIHCYDVVDWFGCCGCIAPLLLCCTLVYNNSCLVWCGCLAVAVLKVNGCVCVLCSVGFYWLYSCVHVILCPCCCILLWTCDCVFWCGAQL